MRKAFKEVRDLVSKIDRPENKAINMTMHLAKLSEEFGELAQAINKFNGRKKRKGETDNAIDDNIVEEGADIIQNVMAIVVNAGGDYETLKAKLHEKNKKFEGEVNRKLTEQQQLSLPGQNTIVI